MMYKMENKLTNQPTRNLNALRIIKNAEYFYTVLMLWQDMNFNEISTAASASISERKWVRQ